MKKNVAAHWFLVFAIPLIAFGLVFSWRSLLMLPLGGSAGVWVAFTADEPYFSASFRAMIAALLAVCLIGFIAGVKFRHSLTGKALVAASVYAWCIVGLVGFGPQ